MQRAVSLSAINPRHQNPVTTPPGSSMTGAVSHAGPGDQNPDLRGYLEGNGEGCRRHAPGSGGVVPGLGLPTADADEGGQQNQSSAGHEADCDGLAAEADGERRGEDRLERHE